MKIIGKAGGSDFIVQVNNSELASIAGYGYSFPNDVRAEVGYEINVSKLWQALSVERNRPDQLTQLAKSLREIAARVESINAALENPIVEVRS